MDLNNLNDMMGKCVTGPSWQGQQHRSRTQSEGGVPEEPGMHHNSNSSGPQNSQHLMPRDKYRKYLGQSTPDLVSSSSPIRNVWANNLRAEFKVIRSLCRDKFNYIAMDTEFPGIVLRPIYTFKSPSEYRYELLKLNCDVLRLIQLGLTLLDEHGNPAPGTCTWQFNFQFDMNADMFAEDSIELLQNSGLDFKRHEKEGIDPFKFSEMLITSGLVLNDEIRWITFHSPYDFGYLYRILSDRKLPKTEKEFLDLLKLYFPFIYDVKYMMKSCKCLKGGLQELASDLDIDRIGQQHQAGSDALLTGMSFFRMKDMYFEGQIDDEKFNGHLFGFSTCYSGVSLEEPLFEVIYYH